MDGFLGRWLGVPVQLVIGFETAPFGGHCWAESEDGSVISDTPEFCRSYQPAVRYW
ncbi:MAG: lasso peptide biosynthesis B2 protein [Planctomycetaceae bacterium]